MLKTELQESLKKNILTVTFTKVDGTERIMKCTLKEDLIPQVLQEDDKPKRVKKDNPNIVSVWDLDNQGWRSFRIESLKSITIS